VSADGPSSAQAVAGAGAQSRAAERAPRLAEVARGRGLDLLLVAAPADLRWLTGYTGSNGLAVLDCADASRSLFLTDFRYVSQVREQIAGGWRIEQASQELLGSGLGEHFDLAWRSQGPARIGYDDEAMTVSALAKVTEAVGERGTLVAAGGLVSELREIKDAGEAERIRAAAKLADEALIEVVGRGLAGHSEKDVAFELEVAMRRRGAEELSFSPIVAGGAHGALPHAEPRAVAIERGTLVTIDWGCRLDGYCSDCTRTFAVGGVDGEAREVYDLVLRAQEASLAAVVPGAAGRDVDAVARSLIADAGHGDHFGHGLGHGVGLEIHEGPRLSRTSESTLAAGMVVTVEPGVYLPGRLGVRIEDLVLVTDGGHEVLNTLPKELEEVD
jgi:Xaa-Pro aminopeptidase